MTEKRFGLRIDSATLERLGVMAEDRHMSINSLLVGLIEEYVNIGRGMPLIAGYVPFVPQVATCPCARCSEPVDREDGYTALREDGSLSGSIYCAFCAGAVPRLRRGESGS